MSKTKVDILKLNLIEVIDEFIIAVESANRARKETNSLEDPIEMTFENFMKWLLYKRNKKNIAKLEKELNGKGKKESAPSPEKESA